jgi:hypothetical protein
MLATNEKYQLLARSIFREQLFQFFLQRLSTKKMLGECTERLG